VNVFGERNEVGISGKTITILGKQIRFQTVWLAIPPKIHHKELKELK
jgi:hypothetical protein